MADLSDVMNALVAQCTQAVYPNGTTSPSLTGAPTTIYPGWPAPTVIDADLSAMAAAIKADKGPTAGRVHVSVYTGNVERNVTKSLDGWQSLGTATAGIQNTAREIRRVERQFQVDIYAPTPTLRDLTGLLIDVALCSLRNLPLADGSAAQIYYATTALDDAPSKEYMFRRTMLYKIEYATFATQEAHLVTEVLTNVKGGYAVTNVIANLTATGSVQ